QSRARAIEDRLSDALHERLTQRFVDRRSATLMRRLKGGAAPLGAIDGAGDVVVEGHLVGRLDGFRFAADGDASSEEARPLLAGARRALSYEIPRRLNRLERAGDAEFKLARDGTVLWEGVEVAHLRRGDGLVTPRVEPVASD